MNLRDSLAEIWPLYHLKISTPRLVLHLPDPEETIGLARVAARGIRVDGEPRYQAEWLYGSPTTIERGLFQALARDMANWQASDWSLGLGIFLDEQPIGVQHIFSRQFAQTRGFGSGIWLGIAYQGQGFGTECGRAVLTFGFDGLDAEEAYIGAWSDNQRSIRMMEKLGYQLNGGYRQIRDGVVVRDQRMSFTRGQWKTQQVTQSKGIHIAGLIVCREMFGVS